VLDASLWWGNLGAAAPDATGGGVDRGRSHHASSAPFATRGSWLTRPC